MTEVKATPRFMRLAKKAMTPETLQELIDTLALNPEQGAVIKDTGELEKFVGQLVKVGANVVHYESSIITTANISFY